MLHVRTSKRNAISRRQLISRTAAVGAALAVGPLVRADGKDAANERLRVGVIGVSRYASGGDGRGTALAKAFAALPSAQVAYVCDVDERHVTRAVELIGAKQSKPPAGVKDFRTILDDKSIDAVVIATPDHWHGPAAILGASAGKHVYVEKPACHNPREGEWMVQAARKHGSVMQLGTQRRSWPAIVEAVQRLKSGDIGRVIAARAFYYNNRPTISRGKEVPVPPQLDFSLWQGPAPERPYRDNLHPYNWHWFWHWGTGEMGNNGVHFVDVARWGLGVEAPLRVTSAGGKYRFPDDDQETPDTNTVTYDFPGNRTLTLDVRSWAKRTPLDPADDVLFHGEKGTLAIRAGSYAIYDLDGKELAQNKGKDGTDVHLLNFIDAVRGNAKPNAEIAEGVKSTLLCHLGNIAWRVGRVLKVDPQSGRIADDAEAMALWGREYRKGWEPVV